MERPNRKPDFKARGDEVVFSFWITERIVCTHTAHVDNHEYEELLIVSPDDTMDYYRETRHALSQDHYAWNAYLRWKKRQEKINDEIDKILLDPETI